MSPRPTEPLAHRVYATLLRVLVPAWLRHRAGDEMLDTVRARLAAAGSRGERWRELAREVAGLARVAVAARLYARPAEHTIPPDPRRWRMLDALRQDLAFAARSMRRDRGVAALAVLTLALGVGASTAMFSVIDGVLLRPMPFPRPERILFLNPTIEEWKTNPSLSAMWEEGRFSAPELRAWLAAQRSFEAAGGLAGSSARVPRGAGSERIPVAQATPGVWAALRVRPLLGRLTTETEPEPVAVVTYDFWRARLGGDSSAVGRVIRLDDRPVLVVGVLPRGFAVVGVGADVWRPLELGGPNGSLGNHWMRVLGRLRDGVTPERARDEAARLIAGAAAVDPKHVTHRARLFSPVEYATGRVRVPLLILAAASGLLLLAACANVALLLLGAGADRARELAVRQALGARQGRIALQLLVESLALGVAGAAAGVLVAGGAVRLLLRIMPEGVPRIGDVGVDLRTFAFAALLAVLTGAVVGCAPALSLSRVDAADALRAGATTAGRGRLQRGIVVLEMALATVLLVGAGLLTRTMDALQRVRPGFEAEGLLTMSLALPWDRFYGGGANPDSAGARLAAYTQHVVDAVRETPGVQALALSSDMPYGDGRATNSVEPEGYRPAPGEVVNVARRFVSGDYFDVMGIRPLQGRALGPADANPNAERVMVVTDRFARHFWPDGRWLDRTVGFWGKTYRVVGVVADTREHDLRGDEDEFKFYAPERAAGDLGDNMLIRASVPPERLVPLLRERVWAVDHSIVITDIVPMTERIARSLADDRYRTRLMVAFSGMAACFSLLGVYGVMSRGVARRRRELGVRLALGAQRRRILALVLAEAARHGVLGVALGVAGALAATRVLERLIWGVPRLDPLTYVAAAAALLALTLAAALVPARRAARVDPMQVIRG